MCIRQASQETQATARKEEEISSPLRPPPPAGGSLPARSHALQTAESLCRSSAHAAAQLEKRAQQCAGDGLSSIPPSPKAVPPYLGGKSEAAPGSHMCAAPHRITKPLRGTQREGHAAHFHPSVRLPNHSSTLARVSRTREVHKPHTSPCHSPLPPLAIVLIITKASLQSLLETKQVTL